MFQFKKKELCKITRNSQNLISILFNLVHIFDITGDAYRLNSLILGISTENVLEVGLTGLNTRVGDLRTAIFKNDKEEITDKRSKQYLIY